MLQQDAKRFGKRRLQNLIVSSSLDLASTVLADYCHWFVGDDYGWRSDWGGPPTGPARTARGKRFSTAQLADHLRGATSTGNHFYSLHTRCKTGQVLKGRFYWTPYLAIDLDARYGATRPLEDRYSACTDLLGTPLVLRSPRHGLHLYWPLKQPVSVLGFTVPGARGGVALIPTLLRNEGLDVRSGNVEVYPTPKHTLRLPLAGPVVQLDPQTLTPLSCQNRSTSMAQLVETMEHLAKVSPVDVLELVSRQPESRPVTRSRGPRNVPGRPAIAMANRPDIKRLLASGLYPGVGRHEACLALARHYMLVRGWSGAATVDALMEWTATKTNGLSEEAAELPNPATERRLQDEYRRICDGIGRALENGLVRTLSCGEGFLSAADFRRIREAAKDTPSPRVRYWREVFGCCLVGFARRHGTPRSGSSGQLALELSVQMMQRDWPRCSGSQYRRALDWARGKGLCALTRRHRPPRGDSLGRARTYLVRVDLGGRAEPLIDAGAILAVARSQQSLHRRVHPQQVEHALLVVGQAGHDLVERYGQAQARRIRALVAAYQGELSETANRKVA